MLFPLISLRVLGIKKMLKAPELWESNSCLTVGFCVYAAFLNTILLKSLGACCALNLCRDDRAVAYSLPHL